MAPAEVTDFGPGEYHIFSRKNGIEFYEPGLFHLNPNYNDAVPILISDLIKLDSLKGVYGAKGVVDPRSSSRSTGRLVTNHPIRRVRLIAKVVGGSLIASNRNNEFLYVNIDDCSGSNLIIQVSVKVLMYVGAGLSVDHIFGNLIEVTGALSEYHDKLEVRADFLRCISAKGNMSIELKHWTKCMKYKQEVLDVPWIYKPPLATAVRPVVVDPPYKQDERNDLIGSQLFHDGYIQSESHEKLSYSEKDLLGSVYLQTDGIMPRQVRRIAVEATKTVQAYKKTNGFPLQSQILKQYGELTPQKEFQERLALEKEMKEQWKQARSQSQAMDSELTPVATEKMLISKIIKYILQQDCRPIKLIDLYKNNEIGNVLNDLTVQRLSFHASGGNKDFTTKKHEVFHSIRHQLQVDLKLIKTTKLQVVKSHNLKKLADHINTCLTSIKSGERKRVFDVPNYLLLYRHEFGDYIGKSVDYKLINWVISSLVQRDQWEYNKARREWRYKI